VRNHKEYQITIPSVIDSNGNFVSHVARKSPLNSRQEQQGDNTKRTSSDDELLHLEIPTSEGKKLQLRLSKNTNFTAPGLLIEEGDDVRQHNLDCHYTGHIADQPNSAVSLSYCQGLVR